MVDMAQGSTLKTILDLLGSFLELPTVLAKFKREEQLATLLHALLCMRGLIMQKTTSTDDCAAKLMKIITSLHENSEVDRRRFVAACVAAMSAHAEGRAEDGRSLVFIFEQLCELICPEKPEPEYKLMLNKTATQEEFIRGSMTKNPYSSKSVGPLMRDIKNKICRDLDLGGLIEDDNGMELLVAGQIIKLDLSVAAVYEQVWVRSTAAQAYTDPASSPMVIVYRLQGLDGEATEPIVETLEEDAGEEQDPEAEYGIADVVGETGGLEVMMSILKRATPLLRARECAALLLKLMQHCCKIRSNRSRMQQMDGANVLLQMLPEALSSHALGHVAERLVLTVESLLEEELSLLAQDGSTTEGAEGGIAAMETDPSTADGKAEAMELTTPDYVRTAVEGLQSPAARDNKPLVKALTRLLPLVTRGSSVQMKSLFDHFAAFTKFDTFDEPAYSSETHAFMLECLVATCASVRNVHISHRIKTAAVEQGLVHLGATYLTAHLPIEIAPETQPHWAAALARPALPLVLQLLGGLARGHERVQQLLLEQPDMMARLHALERQSSSATKAVGTWAEALLEALRERAAAEVDRLRRETTESKRKAAADKRKQILKSMGMAVSSTGKAKPTGGKNKVIISEASAASVMEDLVEEQGHVCVVCGEGATYRPGDTLGTYTFCKRVPLLSDARSVAEAEAAVTASRHDACYSTVTHFNIIHYSCHREATRAERTLKQPKEEWEGATLRNSQTKCNNLFPLWGSTVSAEAYALCVEQWWANLQSIGRVDAPRCRLLAHDLKLLLLRFALEESFSTYSKGGGRESNIKFLPYIVQMATFLLDNNSQPQRTSYRRVLNEFLSQETPPRPGPDSVLYMLSLSLFLQSPAEWAAHRLSFLRRALQYAFNNSGQDRFSLMLPSSPNASPASRPSRSPGLRRSPASGPSFDGGGSASDALLPPSAAQASSASLSDVGTPAAASATPTSFDTCRPFLCYFALVDRLHDILKGKRSWQPSDESDISAEEDRWVVVMRERLRQHDQCVLKECNDLLRDYEDELLHISNFQEYVDILGLLPEVLQAAGSCDAFLASVANTTGGDGSA